MPKLDKFDIAILKVMQEYARDTVFVEIKVGQHSQENARRQQEALLAIPEVVSCFLISGNADFLAEVVVEDLSAYERLLTETLLTLPGVTDIRSNFAIRTIKTAGPLKLPVL